MNKDKKMKLWTLATTTTLLGGSLQAEPVTLNVVNGDFETDASITPGATGWQIEENHFWTSDGTIAGGGLNPTSGANGTTYFLSPNRIDGGANSNPASSFATQNVSVASYAGEIDGEGVTLDVDFWYANSKNTDERTVVSVEFFDSEGISLGSATTGDLTQSPAPAGSWFQYSAIDPGDYLVPTNGDLLDLAVPVSTRSFTITLNLRRQGGSATNTGIDEVSATIDGVAEVPPLVLAVAPNPETPGSFDFEWPGRPGLSYDLVSSPDLSTPRVEWLVWEGNANIPGATEGPNTLSAIVVGDKKRFFAIVEKEPSVGAN